IISAGDGSEERRSFARKMASLCSGGRPGSDPMMLRNRKMDRALWLLAPHQTSQAVQKRTSVQTGVHLQQTTLPLQPVRGDNRLQCVRKLGGDVTQVARCMDRKGFKDAGQKYVCQPVHLLGAQDPGGPGVPVRFYFRTLIPEERCMQHAVRLYTV